MIYSDLSSFTYFRGRVALYAILKALNIGKGDEVATQAFTCVAVPEGIMASCACPIYIDIESMGFNMDAGDLEQKITSKTRAIIVQHTYGIPADMDSLLLVAKRHRIPVIEDCCDILASIYNGKTVGSFGIGSFYSFEWGKPIVVGIGGAAVVNDHELQERVREHYSDYHFPPLINQLKLQLQYLAHRILYRPVLFWQVRSLFHILGGFGAVESNYNPIQDGEIAEDFSMRMPFPLQRRLARKLDKLDAIITHSRRVVEKDRKGIRSDQVLHPELSSKSETVFARYPLIIQDKPALLSATRRANVELADWYSTPVHPLSWKDLSLVHYAVGSCPNAEACCQEAVTLPTHSAVKKSDIDRAIRFLNEF